jgi:hypothetical protein
MVPPWKRPERQAVVVAVPPWEDLERQRAVVVPPWQRPEVAVVLPWERPERQGQAVPLWRMATAGLPKPFGCWKILLALAQRSGLDLAFSSSVPKMSALTVRSPEQAATTQPSFDFSEQAWPLMLGLLGAKTIAGSAAKIL